MGEIFGIHHNLSARRLYLDEDSQTRPKGGGADAQVKAHSPECPAREGFNNKERFKRFAPFARENIGTREKSLELRFHCYIKNTVRSTSDSQQDPNDHTTHGPEKTPDLRSTSLVQNTYYGKCSTYTVPRNMT